MINTSVRFGAIVPIMGEHNHAWQVARDVVKAAKTQGLKTTLVHGPQEFTHYDPATQSWGGISGYTVYTGKDSDNYEAFKAAEKKAVDEQGRLINKQLKELGPPPDDQADPDFWKQYEAHEKRTMIWHIFNPTPAIPSRYDYNLPHEPENYGDFEDSHVVEGKLKAGSLDISG